MANDYLTLAEFKTRSAITSTDAGDDTFITTLITAASRWVDRVTMGYPGWLNTASDTAAVRYFHGRGKLVVWIDECTSVSSVTQGEYPGSSYSSMTADTDYWKSDGSHYDKSPYRMLEINPASSTFSYWPNWARGVKVTAVWGYAATTPEPVKEAVNIITKELYLMRDSGGANPANVTVITDFGVVVPEAISAKAKALIAPYRKIPL